MYQNGSWY